MATKPKALPVRSRRFARGAALCGTSALALVVGLSMPAFGQQAVQYYDGSDTTGATPGVQPSDNVWDTTTTNWTDDRDTGIANAAWLGGRAIFFTPSGPAIVPIVTIGGSGVAAQDIEFHNQYVIRGGPLTLSGGVTPGTQSTITVTNGSLGIIETEIVSTNGFEKLGANSDQLILLGASSYTGITTISEGVVDIRHSDALGATGAGNGTVVASGATLALTSDGLFTPDISVGQEALTLSGSGVANRGALRNVQGTNSIAGAITLAGDTSIGTEANTLTLSGGISGDFDLTLTGNGDGNISGTVATGTGSLTKLGQGTWTLSGTNSYTGGTTVIDGTLHIGDAANAGSIVGALVNYADVAVFNADMSGVTQITNNGDLQFHDDTSAATAAIENNWSLFFFDASSAGRAVIENDLNGVVYFAETTTAADATINNAGLMAMLGDSRAGRASITNTGGLIFDENGSADGATITNSNTVVFVGDSVGGSAHLIAQDGGVFLFGDASNPGNARLTAEAGGVFDLEATWGAGGDGRISAGSIAGAGEFFLGGNELTVGSDNLSTQVEGIVADGSPCGCGFTGGSLVKVGTGTLTMAGINTYTGETVVNDGRLVVNGSIAASSGLTIGPTGSIGGTGVLAPTTVQGTLAPGNSIGTVTVNRHLAFAGGSTYAVEVSPSAADRTDVKAVGGAGTADLSGATVVASYEPGSYVARSYVIVNAEGGLGGTSFKGVDGTSPAGFAHSLSYDANNAYLVLTMVLGNQSGLNPNQQQVADALTAYFNATGGIPAQFAALSPNGLTANSGETGAGGQQAGMIGADRFLDAISNPQLDGAANQGQGGAAAYASERASPSAERFARMGYAAEELGGGLDAASRAMRLQHRLDAGYGEGTQARPERFSIWGAALGGGITLSGNPVIGSQALTGSYAGVASGFGWSNGQTRAGFALGASWSSAAVTGLGTASAGSFAAGLRASHDFGRAYLSGAFAYGLHATATARAFGGETYAAAFTGQSVSARAEAGWRFRTRAVDLLPFLAARAVSLSTPGYAETGSGAGMFALAYLPQTSVDVRSELGLRLHKAIESAGGGRTTLSGMLGWAHYFSQGGAVTAGFAGLPGTQFVTQGATGASDTALVSLGVAHSFAGGLSLSFNADGEFGAGTTSYAARAGLKWRW